MPNPAPSALRRRDEIAKLHGLIRRVHGDVRGLRAMLLRSLRALEAGDEAHDVRARQAGQHLEAGEMSNPTRQAS